jgi:reactive intermediate/imine deaminase
MKHVIQTNQAPAAIGTYSQAVQCGDVLYISGQIPLHPETMQLADASMEAQVTQVFDNIKAVCEAAGATLHQVMKLTVYLLHLDDAPVVNHVMAAYFTEPYPARVMLGVSALPRSASVEIDAIVKVA